MSTAKKEARLSAMLLAKKGAALPAHTDHRLNMQAFEQAEAARPQVEVKSASSDSSMLADAVKEINKVTKRQYSKVVDEEEARVKPATEKRNSQQIKGRATHQSDKKVPAKKPIGAGSRIAMTLRMDQEEHLKLRLFAAHSRKSCQEIISDALAQYLEEDETVCGLSECNCLTKKRKNDK